MRYPLSDKLIKYEVTASCTLHNIINTVTCMGCVTYRQVLDWMIRFTDTLYTQLVTTVTYSVIFTVHCYTH
jgi:hypothetical protein